MTRQDDAGRFETDVQGAREAGDISQLSQLSELGDGTPDTSVGTRFSDDFETHGLTVRLRVFGQTIYRTKETLFQEIFGLADQFNYGIEIGHILKKDI